jgi:hypothetical protein
MDTSGWMEGMTNDGVMDVRGRETDEEGGAAAMLAERRCLAGGRCRSDVPTVRILLAFGRGTTDDFRGAMSSSVSSLRTNALCSSLAGRATSRGERTRCASPRRAAQTAG